MSSFSFIKSENRKKEQVLSGGLVPVAGERMWKGEYSTNTAHMHANGKMIPVETIPGMEAEGDKGEWWRGEFKYDIL
jgi:hypothetical protein